MASKTSLLNSLFDNGNSQRMPVLFIGHGNPMYAIDENPYRKKWGELGKSLPMPSAILCISAHWMTHGNTKVLAMERPKTIHDFGGFPQALFDVQYPTIGSPDFAKQTIELVKKTKVIADHQDWGFDHGCWAPIMNLYPDANIPLYQLSIDMSQSPQYHFDLAKDLKTLRDKGVLIIGSGNIVHNLRKVIWQQEKQFDWALEFDEKVKQHLLSGEYNPLFNLNQFGIAGTLAVPTTDHYLPLMYTLAVKDEKDQVEFFHEVVEYGSLSMRSFIFS